MTIRILNPSIDEYEGSCVIRGQICAADLDKLGVASYQREALSQKTNRHIVEAVVAGDRLPDVELGMLGDHFELSADARTLKLLDPVYLIDGQQRRDTVLSHLKDHPDAGTRLGAIVHVNTTFEWEKARFHALNLYGKRVSPGVLLRNAKETHPAVACLYGLSRDPRFALFNRVSWGQKPGKEDFMSAGTYVSVAIDLHRASGIHAKTSRVVDDMLMAADAIEKRLGLEKFRNNTATFYDVVDSCWGLRNIYYRGIVIYLRRGFLEALAQFFGRHEDFWESRALAVAASDRSKLARFAINDPTVSRLAMSGNSGSTQLYLMLREHVNKRRLPQLRERGVVEVAGTRVHRVKPIASAPTSKITVVSEAILEILRERAKPMTRRDLYSAVMRREEGELFNSPKGYDSFSSIISKLIVGEGPIVEVQPYRASGIGASSPSVIGLAEWL